MNEKKYLIDNSLCRHALFSLINFRNLTQFKLKTILTQMICSNLRNKNTNTKSAACHLWMAA